MYRSCRIISGYFWIKWLHPCHWSNSSGLSHPSSSRVERCAWNGQRLHRRKGQCPSSCSNHTLVDMAQKWSCKGYTSCCLRLNHLIWAHLITEGHCMTNFHFALYNNTVQWWALQLLAIDPPNFCRATRCVRRSDHLAWAGLSLVGLSEIVEGTSVQVFVWPYLVKSWDLGALRIETSWNLQRVTIIFRVFCSYDTAILSSAIIFKQFNTAFQKWRLCLPLIHHEWILPKIDPTYPLVN